MRRFLITTALEETWRDDEPVLFLGEWCRKFSRKDKWSSMDAEVLPYHWDDSVRLYEDYQYLQEFHERLLQGLTKQLSQIHKVEHSKRYWRILVGPWLGYFTQMLFDRWTSIMQARERYDLSETIVLTGMEDSLVPNDMRDFRPFYPADEWNHYLYGVILEEYTAVPCIHKSRSAAGFERRSESPPPMARNIKQSVLAGYSKAAGLLARDTDAFFIATHLPQKDELMLNRRLGQVPQFYRKVPPAHTPIDSKRRQWAIEGEPQNEFESCARSLIPRQIPAVYLEGYNSLLRQVAELGWPRRPKLIMTSNAYSEDDVFKAWAADKVERGSPLVICQHGGHYGIGRWSFTEEHEIDISDRFLSWGWDDPAQPKLYPLGQLNSRKSRRGVRYSKRPGAMLVTTTVPRYCYRLYSVMVSRQWLDYFEDQCDFVAGLPAHIRDALTVRLYQEDYGWEQADRWLDRFPDIRLDEGFSEIDDLIRQSRLYISTYNATTYLESISMNMPTVIYWNPEHWELRDSAAPFFDDLSLAGIFHGTPESAARHVNEIWDDVDTWWGSVNVQKARGRFMDNFCRAPDDLVGSVENALRQIMDASGSQG